MMANKKKMYTNRLAEVHVNSIPNETIRTISSQFNFFYEKISSVQIRKSTKTNQQKLKKLTKNNKENGFFSHKNFEEGGNNLFWVLVLFVHSKSFRKNK